MILNDTSLALSLGLLAAIAWGISGFFDAKASKSVHPIVASFAINGLLTVIYVICYALFLHKDFTMDTSSFLYAAGGGVIIAVGALSYFRALRIGPVTLVSPMSSAYPLVTTLLAVALFGGVITLEQAVPICLIIAGILAATNFLPGIRQHKGISKGPSLGLFTALCWGIGYALMAQAVQANGWQQATLVELIAMMIALGLSLPFLKGHQAVTLSHLKTAFRSKNVRLASVIALIAALSFNIGLQYDHTGGAIVATCSAFYPILTVLLALRLFKESVSKIQLLGALTSVAGVILLTII
ncbi:MAG TPA: DMT family transporter [Candidatus Saccharimonadales bacterium]|nr:DMT family transporter [Candidatus Saccharimonadales bacterium]